MATAPSSERVSVPRQSDDYTDEAADGPPRLPAASRPAPSLEHVGTYSQDPSELPGNIEHFTGVAQVPLGIAGPLLVDGEHAQGEFYVPMATAEGTLVASYNRGMKLLHAAGGVKTTIMDDRMQRAPAFLFESARGARAFGEWLDEHFDEIREVAESTTKSGRLQDIEQYSASRILYTRFNYTTGDAAGQNMTGKATAGRLPLDRRAVPRHRPVLPRGQLRHRQEELADQHAAHARQARRGRGGRSPTRCSRRS